jgi:hypothetical protein
MTQATPLLLSNTAVKVLLTYLHGSGKPSAHGRSQPAHGANGSKCCNVQSGVPESHNDPFEEQQCALEVTLPGSFGMAVARCVTTAGPVCYTW